MSCGWSDEEHAVDVLVDLPPCPRCGLWTCCLHDQLRRRAPRPEDSPRVQGLLVRRRLSGALEAAHGDRDAMAVQALAAGDNDTSLKSKLLSACAASSAAKARTVAERGRRANAATRMREVLRRGRVGHDRKGSSRAARRAARRGLDQAISARSGGVRAVGRAAQRRTTWLPTSTCAPRCGRLVERRVAGCLRLARRFRSGPRHRSSLVVRDRPPCIGVAPAHGAAGTRSQCAPRRR